MGLEEYFWAKSKAKCKISRLVFKPSKVTSQRNGMYSFLPIQGQNTHRIIEIQMAEVLEISSHQRQQNIVQKVSKERKGVPGGRFGPNITSFRGFQDCYIISHLINLIYLTPNGNSIDFQLFLEYLGYFMASKRVSKPLDRISKTIGSFQYMFIFKTNFCFNKYLKNPEIPDKIVALGQSWVLSSKGFCFSSLYLQYLNF